MNLPAAAIWRAPLPGDCETRLRRILSAHREVPVFFRADDIGARNDDRFPLLMELFQTSRTPLCLAVVPAWLDPEGWQGYQAFQPQSSQWCWHQHGYSHHNHQPEGRKAEFGEARSEEAMFQDLSQGRQRLEQILGSNLQPFFTPPWNRCSAATMEGLVRLRFRAISRTATAQPAAPPALPDIPVNIDLHTRKLKEDVDPWDQFYAEIATAAADGRMGFMLHHQLMNRQAAAFLCLLLALLREYGQPCLGFSELLAP
ncbi:DUF2334 domain-containing protein [Desulfogranum mediterraneum]|uniref:DUF2334 domain-containing protein n=1 Tax=Desulfogranum mediterraneum TaxID=160661 RepID=UPI00040B78E3|nr:DUF2334 domain-containing protein [Desulfogranum mediterraneum]